MEFRDAVRYLRSELGLTQVELAMGLHMNAITVGRWENGKTIPTRSITALLLNYARTKGASKECLGILNRAINDAAKSKLDFSAEGLYAVEHASLSQLIDDASFPIYVCDMDTDEILYLNRKANELIGADVSAVGKKCYECLMLRSTPCEFCHKAELVEDAFKNYEVHCALNGATYHVQGKSIQWNGRRAHVECILGNAALPEQQLSEMETTSAWMKTIFENINGGVSVVVCQDDGAVRLAYANDRYYALFGYTKAQFEKEVKDSHNALHPDDWDGAAAEITRVKETKQPATFRYRIVRRDKSIAYIRCSSSVTTIDGISGYVLISVLTDITESTQLEQQAAVSGRRLDAIMQNMNSAVTAVVVKSDGKIEMLFSNDLFHEMLGYSKAQYQLEVTDPFTVVHPDDADALREAVSSLSRVGEVKELQYRAITRNGKIKWLWARISIMSFPDSEDPVQLSIYTDVTDIVEAREKLAARHSQIASILNDTPSGIAIVEVNPNDVPGTMRTVYYNDRFISFSGYEREEYDAMLKKNEMAFVFEEDIPVLLRDTKAMCSGEIGTSVDSMVRCHTKSGGFRWLLLTGQLAEKRDDICVINVAMMDITQRQEALDRQRISDEMLRIAAETDQRAIIIYDVKNNSCRVESRTLFSAKYGEIFENVPQSIIELGIVARDSIDELCAIFARIKNGEQKIRATLQMHSGPDKYEWFECNAATVFDVEGAPDHAVFVFHNIMEQRIKEAVFKKWQQSIETRPKESYTLFRCNLSRDASLDERDGMLLKIAFPSEAMSFNSRTKLYVDECVYPDDREEYSRLLDSDLLLAMFYRGEHYDTMDYREMDKNGGVVWRRLTVETVEYTDSTDVQAFLMYEDIDEEQKAKLTAIELAQSDPLTGALNRGAFAERVDATISENPNAHCALIMLDMDGFKQLNDTFGHSAGDQALQEVAAVLRSYTRNGDLVCRLGGDEFFVWLRDVPYEAVIGKTAQQMCEHIRKAYSQEVLLSASAGIAVYPRDGRSYDELYPNADRALYKVKQAGKGSYAFFSVAAEEQTADISQALSAVRPYPQSPGRTKRRMLIVDDNEANRLTLKNIFKDEFLIETAKNGAEAMIRLRHFGVSISVVLLDLIMPGVDGFAVLRRMQSDIDLRTIPAVIVTGDEEHATLLKAFELGAAEYVAKPIDVDVIRMRVLSVISKAENERLRAQNSYLMLQRDEEMKYRTVLESTGTVVVEYDWRNHVFIYDSAISRHIAGNFDHRGLWQVLLSDMVADSSDAKALQDGLIGLANNRDKNSDCKLIKLKTPEGIKHWFRVNIYKSADEFGLAEKLIITFNDVHEEVLANHKLLFQATRDELTGLYNRAGFFEKAAELIAAKEPGYYVMACIDIEKFKVINDQYGTEKGDEVLCKFARTVEKLHTGDRGICCRVMADNFAVLFPTRLINSQEFKDAHDAVEHLDDTIPAIRFAAGRCLVDDKTLDVSAIYDRAVIAKNTVKGRYDTHIATFDESMRTAILRQQEITGQMNNALESGQFEVWLQPQFNHATGMLSGAEALVRWRHPVEGIIPPAEFIPIFERNGFVYEVDKYVWEQTCILLRKWLDQGLNPVPVSVNISRYDVFRSDLISVIEGLVKKYDLPIALLRLEITESAFTESAEQIIKTVEALVEAGFTVEIDDFGSGYSSLNTLKDVPAQVLKMDMRFLENDRNVQRGGSIIESVVRMAKWLGMSVIAEGVETIEQADYLKSIGCTYIQGYLYSRPTQVTEYEKLFAQGRAESELKIMSAVETWNNNAFWNPVSMETLIFNSYVGGACIFEYYGGKAEMLRYNDQYVSELHGLIPENAEIQDIDIVPFLDGKSREKLVNVLHQALESGKEAACEMRLTKGEQTEYVRSTLRVIAKTTERTLYYCVIQNLTEQRKLERERTESAERLSIIMSNVNGGVSAIEINDDGTSKLVFHNDKYYELYGYFRAEKGEMELDPMSFIVPEDFPGVMEKVKKLKADGRAVVIDYGITKLDGSRAQIRANASLMTMEGYGPIITSVLTDVTEQRTLEDQLRAVVDNINGGVTATYYHDGELRFALSNDKYYEILGFTREQYDAEVKDVFSIIHPEDRERVQKLFTQAVQAERPYTMEYRIVRRNGAVRYILCNANIMHIFGIKEPIQLAVFNDVTLLREAQLKEQSLTRQMQTIMANINGGVTATVFQDETHLEIIFANDGYYELFGYTKELLEAEVHNVLDLILQQDRPQVIETVARIVRERGSETYEYRCRKRDGSIIWIQTTNTVISLAGVSDTVLIAVSTDITALRRAEEQSRATSDRLSAVMNAMTSGMTAVAFCEKGIEFLFANDRYYQLHGTDRESCGQDGLHDAMAFVYPDDRKRISSAVMQMNEIGASTEIEYRVKRADGMRWIKTLISVTTLGGIDTPVQVAIYSDITDEKKASEQLRFLNESASEILAQPDSEKAINNTLQKLLNYFSGERAYIFELNDAAQTSDNTYERCAPGVTPEIERLRGIPYDVQQYWFDAFRSAGSLIISDTAALPETEAKMRALLLSKSIRAIILAPLWRDGRLIGYVGVDNPTVALDQVSQIIALSDYIAVLLTRRDLMQTVERERQTVQQLMDDTPGGFVRMELFEDKNPAVVTVNDGICKMLNMTREELMQAYGENVYACLAEEDAASAPEEIAEAYALGRQYTSTCRLRKKGGGLFWVMLFGRFVHGEAGRLYLNAYFTDITEQRSIEQLQSELLENLPSGAALYEFDGENIRAIHINKHYWALVERSALSAEKTAAFGVFHPDDRPAVIDELKAAIRQGRNAACTARIICGDGSYKPFNIVTNNVREQNGNYLLYATFTRISDEEMAIQNMLPMALSTIVANTDDMSYVKDKNLRYICVSQSVAEMAGANSPRDLIGKTAADAFDPKFAVKFDDDDSFIIETGKPVVRALEHIPTKDGAVCLARTTKFPILDAMGNAIGVYCISHDITAQKEKESQLELLTDTIPGGLAAYSISNEGYTTLYFNDGFYDYSGYTREEYVALTQKEPLALMLPEDRHILLDMVHNFANRKQDGMTGNCTYRCRTKGGEIRWMSLKAVLSQVSEEAYVLNVVQLDVTERMNAEKRQGDLLDNLPFGAAMYEFDGKTLTAIHINKRYIHMVNREVDTSLEGFAPMDAIHPDDRKLVLDEIAAAIAQKRNAACDIRLLYGSDAYRLFHLDARIVRGDNGKFMLYVAYERITDRDKELKETSERLKLLSNSIPGGIATFRCMVGNIEPIYYNDGICALTGYSREEFNNSSISVLGMIFDEDKPVIEKQIKLLVDGASALDYSVRIHTKNGGYKWVECMASVTGREDGNVFLVSAVITDVTEHQEERERLRVSEELSRLAIDQSGKIISRYDVAKRTLTLPYMLPDMYNVPRVLENMPEEQVRLGRISPDTADTYCGVFARINNGEASGEAVYQQNSTLGWRWLKSRFTTVFASDGKPVSAVITFEDITEQRDKEAIYTRWQNAMAERAADSYTIVRCNLNKSNMIDSWDGNLLRVHFTDATQPFNARTAEYTERCVYADDRVAFRAFLNSDTMLAEYHRGHRSDSIDYREQNEDGSVRWLRLTVDLVEYPDSTDVEAYLLYENIDEQKHLELSTIRRAETDPLTGVFNRTAFAERVNQAISRLGTQQEHALFVLDVDGFKRVNDVFGHGAGDQILTDLANILTRLCRKEDIVGRLGGDEFFVFLSSIGSAETAARKAQKLCDMTRKALSVDVHISTSIGIALCPQNGDGFEALYKTADEALYRTKNAGKDGYAFSSGDPVIGTLTKWRGNQYATQTAEKQQQKARRILIVDDDKIAQAMLEGILKDTYNIEKAMDGASALTILHHYGTAVSAVLLDLLMPTLSGFEVLEKMQQDERMCTIPVIVVSADEDRETALRVIRAGAYDLITKPVDADLLRIRVESAISKAENERLRAQNSYLAIRNTEVNSYRAALERTGTMVIMLDRIKDEFSYSQTVAQKLAGQYDERTLWSILLLDKVADENTVQGIQQLVEAIAGDSERTEGSIKVRLKTRSGLFHIFELNVFKELDDYGLASKMIITLKEAAPLGAVVVQ